MAPFFKKISSLPGTRLSELRLPEVRLPKALSFKTETPVKDQFQPLKETITYLSRKQKRSIYDAFLLARKAHQGQSRRDGQPYITHPVAVAVLLAQLKLDTDTIIAALIHDVVEDTQITLSHIEKQFGSTISHLVDGVSKLDRVEFNSNIEAQHASLQKMILAMASDLRVLLIKLADRVHNSETLEIFNQSKRNRIGTETLEIYAPLAARLGLHAWQMRLENNALYAMQPWRYKILSKAIKKAKGERRTKISEVSDFLKKRLKEAGISAEVQGREKHLYSVFLKMQARRNTFDDKHLYSEKNRDPRKKFDQILDLFAFRIIVNSVDECYRVLGIMHSIYRPVPEKIKDYISLPKANGYQSLHTILFGPSGAHVEIQIRTKTMHENAENGIAAHWSYKSSGSESPNVQNQKLSQKWINDLIEVGENAGTSSEFLESVKADLFPQEVFVFTPKGKIYTLPRGSTALDLAYAIHSDLGNHCVACEIDRQRVEKDTLLQNGQTVYFHTSNFGQPSPDWLTFLVTAKARTQVRQYLKSQTRDEVIKFGKEILERAMETLKSPFSELSDQVLKQALDELKMPDLEQLFYQIGIGGRPPRLVAKKLYDLANPYHQSEPSKAEPSSVQIKDAEGISIAYGRCCYPLPGDNIMGHLSLDKGLVVHRLQCKNVRRFKKKPENCVPVQWQENTQQVFPIPISIECENKAGMLSGILSALWKINVEIDSANVEKGADNATIKLIVLLSNRRQLAQTLRVLRKLPNVTKVLRGWFYERSSTRKKKK